LLALPALAVDGTVTNQTTGKPAQDATVTLYKLGQAGPEALESVHTDAAGHFEIKASPQAGGPSNLQATYQGVTYAHLMPPGSPTTGIALNVYNASKQPGEAKVGQHFLILQPSAGQMLINEVFLYKNEGKTAYNDPDSGTLKFFLPAAANGVVKVQAKAPGGMPLEQLAQKTPKPNIYKIDFPIKPGGETQFDLTYMVPYTSPGRFGSKDVAGSPETLLVAPQGVELKGDGVELSRTEPRTQASIYTVKKSSFELSITGQMAASETQGQQGAEESNSGPTIDQVMPKLFGQIDGTAGFFQKVLAVKWILLLAVAILALGFTLLFRMQPPLEPAAASASNRDIPSRDREGAKESNERRRR
jgi:hypothetical protein